MLRSRVCSDRQMQLKVVDKNNRDVLSESIAVNVEEEA